MDQLIKQNCWKNLNKYLESTKVWFQFKWSPFKIIRLLFAFQYLFQSQWTWYLQSTQTSKQCPFFRKSLTFNAFQRSLFFLIRIKFHLRFHFCFHGSSFSFRILNTRSFDKGFRFHWILVLSSLSDNMNQFWDLHCAQVTKSFNSIKIWNSGETQSQETKSKVVCFEDC